MKEKLRIYWPYLLLIPFVAAAIVGWFVLPDEMVMRMAADGQPVNTIIKPVALLLPVALSALGSSQACHEGRRRVAGILILAMTAVLTVMLFVWNL